jgi:large subunit ribosomal protein L32e
MPEEETPPAPPKKVKKTLPEAPPEAAAEPKLPTSQEIRAAKKADLVTWAESFGLDSEGKVDDLRERVAEYVLKEHKAAAAVAEITAPAPKAPAPEKAPAKAAEKKAAPKPAPKPAKEAKAKAEKKPSKEEKEEAEEEAGKEEAEEEYEAKQKPKLDPHLERLLAVRALKSASRPAFHRQEWFRYKRFGDEWRKPQGGQSKLRRHFGYRWNLPSIGYRGPRAVRGLHPSGFQEVLVHNERQLEGLDPAKQAVRIAHGVGARKREMIEKACDDKGLRVLNRMVTE